MLCFPLQKPAVWNSIFNFHMSKPQHHSMFLLPPDQQHTNWSIPVFKSWQDSLPLLLHLSCKQLRNTCILHHFVMPKNYFACFTGGWIWWSLEVPSSLYSSVILLNKVQQGQVHGVAVMSVQSYTCVQTGIIHWEQIYRVGLECSGGWKAGHESAVCTCSSEDQEYPELHQKRCAQQDREVVVLLCSDRVKAHRDYCVQTWGLSTRKMWGCWCESRGGLKDNQSCGAPLLWKQAVGTGLVQSG